METVDGLPERPQGDQSCRQHADGDSLLSSRSLLIFLVAIGVGLLVGMSAGLAAGVATAQALGLGAGLIAGVVAGIGATAVATLSVAGMLHALVGRRFR